MSLFFLKNKDATYFSVRGKMLTKGKRKQEWLHCTLQLNLEIFDVQKYFCRFELVKFFKKLIIKLVSMINITLLFDEFMLLINLELQILTILCLISLKNRCYPSLFAVFNNNQNCTHNWNSKGRLNINLLCFVSIIIIFICWY